MFVNGLFGFKNRLPHRAKNTTHAKSATKVRLIFHINKDFSHKLKDLPFFNTKQVLYLHIFAAIKTKQG